MKNNPLTQHQYYLNHKERIKEQSRQYYLEHQEEAKQNTQAYYKANKQRLLIGAWEYGKRLKLEILAHYSISNKPYCTKCGIDDIDVLTIDHINGGGNEHRRQIGIGSGSGFYGWLKRNNYPDGFQVLCFNCNIKKKIEGLNERHTIN